MIREAPAVTVRQNLGEILNQVQYRNDTVLITRDGKPVAAIVDVVLFERIRRMRDEFDRLVKRLGETYANVDEATAEAEIDAAVRYARAQRSGKAKRR